MLALLYCGNFFVFVINNDQNFGDQFKIKTITSIHEATKSISANCIECTFR